MQNSQIKEPRLITGRNANNTRTGLQDFWKIMNQRTRREKSSKRIGPIRNNNDLLVYEEQISHREFLFATVGEKLGF